MESTSTSNSMFRRYSERNNSLRIFYSVSKNLLSCFLYKKCKISHRLQILRKGFGGGLSSLLKAPN